MTQSDFWNSEAGAVWATQSLRIDGLLEPFGLEAMRVLDPRPGERILDVGCGAGATSRDLAARVGTSGAVVGVDISAPLLDLARDRGGGVEYLLGDAGATPLPGPFDAIFSRFGVMFFDEPVAAFGHLRGALKPGGRITFICWRSFGENAWARDVMNAALPLLREPPPQMAPGAPGPFAFADGGRLRGILESAGFLDVGVAPLDTNYRLGEGPVDAADLCMRLGPLARIVREQKLDGAPIQAVLESLMERHAGQGDGGVAMPAACWIVTGRG